MKKMDSFLLLSFILMSSQKINQYSKFSQQPYIITIMYIVLRACRKEIQFDVWSLMEVWHN